MKRYIPPMISEEKLLEEAAFLTASNESYEVDEFDPDFIIPQP